ncbi:XkdX family protein [Lentilactobacillus senioris]
MIISLEMIKMQWSWGMMTDDQLGNFVIWGNITPEQYKEISGKEYVAPTA